MSGAATTPESHMDRFANEISELGLQRYVEALHTDGYAVIPPERQSESSRRAHARSLSRYCRTA